jgi:hypothetical protein
MPLKSGGRRHDSENRTFVDSLEVLIDQAVSFASDRDH